MSGVFEMPYLNGTCTFVKSVNDTILPNRQFRKAGVQLSFGTNSTLNPSSLQRLDASTTAPFAVRAGWRVGENGSDAWSAQVHGGIDLASASGQEQGS